MPRGEGRKDRAEGTWGSVDKRATGYRARYIGPDGRRHVAPTLFVTKGEARAWLAVQRADIVKGKWMPADAVKPAKKVTLTEYADAWLPKRKVRGQPLKPRTREHYQELLGAAAGLRPPGYRRCPAGDRGSQRLPRRCALPQALRLRRVQLVPGDGDQGSRVSVGAERRARS